MTFKGWSGPYPPDRDPDKVDIHASFATLAKAGAKKIKNRINPPEKPAKGK